MEPGNSNPPLQGRVIRLGELEPRLDPSVYLAAGSLVIGDVTIGAQSSVWFYSVLRGDVNPIKVGRMVNIQDMSMLHVHHSLPLIVGDRVSMGHGVVVHACVVEDGCLIGIRSVILNGAVVGAESIIGAGALVPPGMHIPPRSLVMGVPGKVVRQATPEDLESARRTAESYIRNAELFRSSISWGESRSSGSGRASAARASRP
jgi:carbonic anhydrase/acetyltransferase-like protein (isoleucine patch superfamily)